MLHFVLHCFIRHSEIYHYIRLINRESAGTNPARDTKGDFISVAWTADVSEICWLFFCVFCLECQQYDQSSHWTGMGGSVNWNRFIFFVITGVLVLTCVCSLHKLTRISRSSSARGIMLYKCCGRIKCFELSSHILFTSLIKCLLLFWLAPLFLARELENGRISRIKTEIAGRG